MRETRGRMCGLLLLQAALLAITLGCASTLPSVPSDFAEGTAAYARATSLRNSVEALVDGWGNHGRFRAARARAADLGLEAQLRTEWIDWFSTQRNAVIEIPGKSDKIIYIVAHYDKTDINPPKLASLLVNGLFDDVVSIIGMSDGAVDNATGVAVALELGGTLRRSSPYYTYRILLAGSEESGLRGSRSHVARLSDAEKEALALAVNIDCVGLTFSPNAVTANVSDQKYMLLAEEAAKAVGAELERGVMPAGASSDFAPFASNSFFQDFGRGLSFARGGGFLPQRSWFTSSHSAPVVNFSAKKIIDASDMVAGIFLIPVGRLHGPRDRPSQIDIGRLHEQYEIIREFLRMAEDEAEARAATL